MAKRRKRGSDPGEIHEQQRFEREARTGKIAERFPGVKRILIRLRFEDIDRHCNPEPRELEFDPTSTAFFELKCPLYQCVKGGFNFSAPVAEMNRTRQLRSKGHSVCQGWQDRERINKHRCLLTAHYEIQVGYSSAV